MQVGNIFEDAWDAGSDAIDEASDLVTSAIDNLADAGALIGGILKTVSPMLAYFPGIGTGLAIAAYAGGAIAAGDSITDAAIGTVSAGMPPGLPRIGFDSGVAITRDVAEGRNAFGSIVDACRSAAGQAGGERAVAAFDAALNAARGGRIDDRAIAMLRTSFANGGTAEALAFDAGVGIARGENATDVLLDVARSYIAETGGGPLALAAFDTGVALGYGETLQEAGFTALHRFVKGTGAEKVYEFVDDLIAAKRAGKDLKQWLTERLTKELQGAAGYGDAAFKQIGPVLERLRVDPALLDTASDALGRAWNVAEPVVRAAQVILSQPSHEEGQAILDAVVRPPWLKDSVSSNPNTRQIELPPMVKTKITATTALSAAAAIPVAPPPIVYASYKPTGVVVSTAPPPAPAIVQSVASTTPAKPKTGVAGDLVLGATVAAAGVALYWFFRE